MRFEDRTINTIGELIENLKKDYASYAGPIWFRGHSNFEWKLTSSIDRCEGLSEMNLV